MPLMSNIDARHKEKSNKYSHFLTDITGYTTTVNCFEVSSTGYIFTMNQKTLQKLHKFVRKDIRKSLFMSNLNSLAWYGSYQIWLSRKDPSFSSPSYLIPHLSNLTPPVWRWAEPRPPVRARKGPWASSSYTRCCNNIPVLGQYCFQF